MGEDNNIMNFINSIPKKAMDDYLSEGMVKAS